MSSLIPSLPDEISILCIARVQRSHHPFLSAVSRAWRDLLRSPFFFSTRIELGASQPFLFINVRSPTNQYHCYLLNRNLRQNDSSALIPLPAQPHPSAICCAAVSLGHSLYLLGGLLDGQLSPIVQIYDARFNYWRRGPNMSASRKRALARVISGRIYVLGGCRHENEYWAEEFDQENNQWKRVPSPIDIRLELPRNFLGNGTVIGGKLFMMTKKGCCVVFDPAVAETELVTQAEKAWSMAPSPLCFRWTATVKEVLYRNITIPVKIHWYDFTKRKWRPVEGVDKELPNFLDGPTMINLGQDLCLVSGGRWEGEKIEVICVGVSLTKIDTGEIQGSVEWQEMCALPCPKGTSIVDYISLEF